MVRLESGSLSSQKKDSSEPRGDAASLDGTWGSCFTIGPPRTPEVVIGDPARY
jgi:hypothetical protein